MEQNTDKFEHNMGDIVLLWTKSPPPTQCISDPLLLFSSFTLMVRHMRKQL